MPNTSNITNMPDLKKLFVYVNFTNVDAQGGLTSLKGQLKTSSETKYPDRVFYVANDGSIITHGKEFGISDDLRKQINGLATDSVNFKSSIKNLTGIDVPVGEAAEITADSIIGKYVNKEILKNKTIVAAKADTAVTVEETANTAGTTTYTIGLTVDGKTIVANGGALKTAVKLVKKYCAVENPGKDSRFYDDKINTDGNSVHPVILLTDNAGAILDIVDGNEFVTDGMLDTVTYDDKEGTLTFTWNTDSGRKESTSIDIKKIFQIENIHTKTPDYITVDKETPGQHGDAAKLAYHVDAKVDATDLTAMSTVTYTPNTNYAVNGNFNGNTDVTKDVSGLADAKKVADKIRAIDVAIAGVGNDAIAREKTIADGIDDKIEKLREDLNKEVTDRSNADNALYGGEIPVAGPTSTITGNAAAIATLNANENTAGSVDAKIKALKEKLDAEVTYQDEHELVKVAVSQVDGVVVAKTNAVTVKTGALTSSVNSNPEYTLDAGGASTNHPAGGYSAKDITTIAQEDPALVTNQDAWIYGQCIKSQAIKAINSDNNQYIKIVREDNKTKVAFEPWTEIHTIEELAQMDGANYTPGN